MSPPARSDRPQTEDAAPHLGGSGGADPDPLYDPAFLIFVYSAWALVAFTLGQMAGLVVLVVSTAIFTVLALRQDPPRVEPGFVPEFGTILLFCCAAVGAGTLLIAGFEVAPEVTMGGIIFVSGACLGLFVRR